MNLANAITITRICLVPVFLALLLSGIPEPYNDIAAAAVFLLAAGTDKLDGYIARSRNTVTALGQFLDPLADKLLTATALIALAAVDRVPVWVAVVIIAREVAVSVLRVIGASQGVSIPADRYGKLKTVLQIVYIVYVLLPVTAAAEVVGIGPRVITAVAAVLALVVVVITLWSGVRYFLNARGVVHMPGTS